jgi:hypothetical protein
MSLPNITYTSSYISDGQNASLSLKNFYETLLVGDIDNTDYYYRIPISDFFIKHRDELSNCIEYYAVPQRMFYQPKTLSYEIYGTTELWLSILRVNNMRHVTEFHQPIIKVYNPDSVKQLINIFFKREGIKG